MTDRLSNKQDNLKEFKIQITWAWREEYSYDVIWKPFKRYKYHVYIFENVQTALHIFKTKIKEKLANNKSAVIREI